ncbi:hypothetical protein JCM15519_28300 [Fundidesulfovibrio butyratiphilus]
MTHPLRIALILPRGPLHRWRADLAADLSARGHDLALFAPTQTDAPEAELPRPAMALYAPQALLRPASRNPLAKIRPAKAPPATLRHPLEHAARARFDLIVWAGHGAPFADPIRQLCDAAPLGMLVLEPPVFTGFFPGHVAGRLLWKRGQAPARLALETVTCLPGPFLGSCVREHFAKACRLPGRALERIRLEGEAYWDACPPAPCAGRSGSAPGPAASTPFSGLGLWANALAALAVQTLRRAWQDLACRRQWFLAERQCVPGPDAPDFASRPFVPVPLPAKVGQADPFVFVHEGRTWCFLEEIPPNGRGVIAVRERLGDGSWSPARRVLEEPFHLSYPFVFTHQGQTYMIPETGQAGRVGLYRATDFPGGWVLERELLSGVTAVDATLVEHDNRWWMFVNLRPPGGSSWDELHLYSAADPLGPYTPHPHNPVVSDVRRARPAGRVFRHAGRLYRPGQDCSGWYGRGLALMEITRLDAHGYAERPAARLDAGLIPESFCLHTYQAGPGFELVDGQRFRPVWKRKNSRQKTVGGSPPE